MANGAAGEQAWEKERKDNEFFFFAKNWAREKQSGEEKPVETV